MHLFEVLNISQVTLSGNSCNCECRTWSMKLVGHQGVEMTKIWWEFQSSQNVQKSIGIFPQALICHFKPIANHKNPKHIIKNAKEIQRPKHRHNYYYMFPMAFLWFAFSFPDSLTFRMFTVRMSNKLSMSTETGYGTTETRHGARVGVGMLGGAIMFLWKAQRIKI